jgi:hypothetical protein
MTDSAEFQAWIDRAKRTTVGEILGQRGIKLVGRKGRLCGPCPRCGGDDRFAVDLTKKGKTNTGAFHCRGCGIGGYGAIDLVIFLDDLARDDFIEAVARINSSPPPPKDDETESTNGSGDDDVGRIRSALRLWREAGPIEGTPAITYFERERGIFDLPPASHDVLRFHRHCVFGQDKAGNWIFHTCIIALYRNIITNEPTGVHRIALDADGKLIGRMGLGRKQGSAIKFWRDEDVTMGLVVGEGIETTLAAAMHVQYQGTLLQPAWSLIDAGNLARFPIVPEIEHLTVLADADANNTGQNAARTCAKQYAEAHREAVVLIPDRLGEDFNDIARKRRQKRQVSA